MDYNVSLEGTALPDINATQFSDSEAIHFFRN